MKPSSLVLTAPSVWRLGQSTWSGYYLQQEKSKKQPERGKDFWIIVLWKLNSCKKWCNRPIHLPMRKDTVYHTMFAVKTESGPSTDYKESVCINLQCPSRTWKDSQQTVHSVSLGEQDLGRYFNYERTEFGLRWGISGGGGNSTQHRKGRSNRPPERGTPRRSMLPKNGVDLGSQKLRSPCLNCMQGDRCPDQPPMMSGILKLKCSPGPATIFRAKKHPCLSAYDSKLWVSY